MSAECSPTKGKGETMVEEKKMEEKKVEEPRVDILQLPSKYLVYNVDPKAVQLRTFKGKDEKLIASLSYENFESKLSEIIQNTLTGLDAKELTIGDRLYILLWQTIHSYTKMFSMEHQCTSCFEKSKYDVDLTAIEVIDLPDGFKEPYPLTLSDGRTINVRLFRSKDEERAKEFEKATKQNPWLYRYGLTIIDAKMNDFEKMTMLEELPAVDVALIRAFHEKYIHGPKMEVTVECRKCGASEVALVPFRLELFFPFGEALRRYFGGAV